LLTNPPCPPDTNVGWGGRGALGQSARVPQDPLFVSLQIALSA
jgi:hypothetical protein